MVENRNHAAMSEGYRDPWHEYVKAYRKRNPDKVYRWNINSYVRKIAKHVKEHPEEAQELKERMFGA